MLVEVKRIVKSIAVASAALLIAMPPSNAQSNRSLVLGSGGVWHLRSHIPLGVESLVLEPSHRVIEMLASAEAPEFAGWTMRLQNDRPVLLDALGKPARTLPRFITFRVTVSARDILVNADPFPLNWKKSVDEFLCGMRFKVQVFRGMEMRSVNPARQWMIGVPADESSDERIYRASFDLGDVRPDDRIVLLVTDDSGTRLLKFHLEFL